MKDLSKQIMSKINTHKIKMRPRILFVVEKNLLVLAVGAGGGLLLSTTKANDAVGESAKKSNIPVISHAYKSAEPKMLNSGTFIKIIGKRQGDNFEAYNIAPVKNSSNIFATEKK